MDDNNNNALVFTSKRKRKKKCISFNLQLLGSTQVHKSLTILFCYSAKVFDFMWFMSECGLKCQAWDLNGLGGLASFQCNQISGLDIVFSCFKPVCQAAWLWYHISLNAYHDEAWLSCMDRVLPCRHTRFFALYIRAFM